MAQAGYTPIQLYYSSTASAVPLAANLAAGELAINTTDGKLYYKTNGGVVTLLASSTTVTNSFSAGTTGLTPNTATTGAVTLAGTLITSNGGTGLASYTAGDLSYFASGTALTKLAIGTAGQILTSSGTAPQWSTLSGVAVTTLSFGTTGLTPSTATSGAITVAGTLVVGNGGTGLTTLSASRIPYGNGTSAFQSSANLTFDGQTLTATNSGAATGPSNASYALNASGGSNFAARFDGTGEAYVINTASSKSQYYQAGTQVVFNSLTPTSPINTGCLIDFNAYNSASSASNVFIGAVAGNSNAAANFVIGRRTGTNSWAESVRVNTLGYFGVGTNNPQYLLDVYADSGINTVARFYNNTASGNTDIYVNNVGTGGDMLMTRRANGEFWLYQSGAYPINLYTTSANRLQVGSAGHIMFGSSAVSTDRYIGANFGGVTVSGTSQFGVVLNPTFTNNGTSVYGYYVGLNFSNTLTNAFGIYIDTNNGGTITNRYGLYQAGVNDRNYFAGLTTFNQAITANSTLSVSSYITCSSIVVNDPGASYYSYNNRVGGATAFSSEMTIGSASAATTAGLRVQGAVNPVSGIVADAVLSGFVASNYTGTRYWLIDNMTDNPSAAIHGQGFITAASYTTWNLCQIWFRREYSTFNCYGGITGFSKSAVTVSLVDITYNSKRYLAISFAGGDPGISCDLNGYRLNNQHVNGAANFINGTAGVTVNSTIATY